MQCIPITDKFNWGKLKNDITQMKRYLKIKPKRGTLDGMGVRKIPCKSDLRQALHD